MPDKDKQPTKPLEGEVKTPTPELKKEQPGTDPKQPANADYDYRPDYGTTGGGVEHNPEADDQLEDTKPSKAVKVPSDK